MSKMLKGYWGQIHTETMLG